MTKVSIIIPVWNLWNMTLQCLESLAATCAVEIRSKKIEVIVVDNGSHDETATALQPTLVRLFGTYGRVLRLPKNVGFANACNAGAKVAIHPLLFFLNNDTILTENWLPPLIYALESNPALGMVGPLLLYLDNTVQHCGICTTPKGDMAHLYHKFPSTHPAVHKQRLLQAITGAALLMPAQLFRECEGFHKGYMNGFEDIDLCYKVRKKGRHLLCVPQSRIYHITSQTQGRFDHDLPNTELFFARNAAAVIPDMHSISAADGYVPKFNDSLDLYVALPQAKEDTLTQMFTQHFTMEKCLAKLQEEPFWVGGHTLLAAHHEAQGQWQKAARAWSNILHFQPTLHHIISAKRIAMQANMDSLLKGIILMEQRVRNDLSSPEKLQQETLRMKQWAVRHKDTLLESMVEMWFLENTQK